MSKEKHVGLNTLPWDTLLSRPANPTEARTIGKFPPVCSRPGFRVWAAQSVPENSEASWRLGSWSVCRQSRAPGGFEHWSHPCSPLQRLRVVYPLSRRSSASRSYLAVFLWRAVWNEFEESQVTVSSNRTTLAGVADLSIMTRSGICSVSTRSWGMVPPFTLQPFRSAYTVTWSFFFRVRQTFADQVWYGRLFSCPEQLNRWPCPLVPCLLGHH